MMRTFQPLAIGIYEAMGGKINNRLVYKHVKSKFNFPVLNFLVANDQSIGSTETKYIHKTKY